MRAEAGCERAELSKMLFTKNDCDYAGERTKRFAMAKKKVDRSWRAKPAAQARRTEGAKALFQAYP